MKTKNINILQYLKHFSEKQQYAIKAGKNLRNQLHKIVNDACDRKSGHTYIYSQPGYGKTFTLIGLNRARS